MLFTGYGFHFSESRREPLMGGLIAFSRTGNVAPPPMVPTSDCPEAPVLSGQPTFTNVYEVAIAPEPSKNSRRLLKRIRLPGDRGWPSRS
jgi:hypothetical protein